MVEKISYQQLRVGDRLVREKGWVFSKHHAIYIGKCQNGIPLVAENQLSFGVRYITLNQFLSEGRLVRLEKFKGNIYRQQEILNRVKKLIGKEYNLFTFNCEHFVNNVLLGKSQSSQIKTAFGLLIFIGLILGLRSKN